ncbi:MAG: DUF6763 family protein [Gammaproteobacteria bacterium]
MPIEQAPIVSQWYQHLDKGYKFLVAAVDEDEGTVELQHFDGDLEEIDIDSWHAMDIESIEPPEDWTGPMDDIERDDLGYTETDMTGDDWAEPLRDVGKGFEEEEEGETPKR